MKKLLTVLSLVLVVALFAGCSFLPSFTAVKKVNNPQAVDLFNYDGVKYQDDQVLVRVSSNVNVEKLMQAQGSKVLQEWKQIGWAAVSVPQGETALSFIKKLKKQQGILMAEPNMEYNLNDADPTVPAAARYSEQWAFKNLNAEAGWKITTGDSNTIVTIIDTGVDMKHPEFADKTFIDYWDATVNAKQMKDLDNHGTHVAGIAADNGRNGQIAGVAWDCPILPIRVKNDDGKIYTSYLISAMIWIADWIDAHPEYRTVVNMSIGGRGYNFAFKDAIDYAYDAGVLLICSAGNDGKRVPQYPSAYNGVVAVAATTPYDTKATFSTIGWWNSVAAPGVQILSTVSQDNITNNGVIYQNMQGTSMATPYVTGSAALLLSHNKYLTPLQLKNQIEQTARGNGHTEEFGWGVTDIAAMLGDLKPMYYGSLYVDTNIISNDELGWIGTGVVTAFDTDNNLVGFGTTGEKGNYFFQAIKPGKYTVNVTYYDMYKDAYEVKTVETNVAQGQTTSIKVNVGLPTSIDRTNIFTHTYAGEVATVDVPVTIAEDGIYEFITSMNQQKCDTIITLKNAQGEVIAQNDDFMDNYSRILLNLKAGEYTLTAADFNEDALWAVLDINKLAVTY